MRKVRHGERLRRLMVVGLGVVLQLLLVAGAHCSTYVVYIPLDSSIYTELDTLNGLGYLDTYFSEIKPISRVEAARLTLEAQANIAESDNPDMLAHAILLALKEELKEEIGWLESNTEDSLPTMIHPLERVEAQYLYSSGPRRQWLTGPNGPINAEEQTPLLPNNDGLPTSTGSNEIIRLSGWGGFGGFLTGYAEGAVAGPATHDTSGASRGQLLGAETVLSLGNTAVSFGQEERSWGTGYFASLSQSNNAKPFYGLTLQNVHPKYLPWILRYLGPGRRQIFMGQLDADRATSQHPWIVGHAVVFKPLPWFEIGMTRTIIFGGRNNDHYNFSGFTGRFTGIATGKPAQGNTKSRGGIFFKFRFPKLRNLELYQEILGSDNLTYEVPTLGHYMPFLSVAYEGGFYLPRLTADGLTDLRFEYTLLPGSYAVQNGNSLYFTYENQLLGDPLGPNVSEVDLQIGRWFGLRYKADVDFFYTEQAPNLSEGSTRFYFPADSVFYPYALTKEHSFGVTFDLVSLPVPVATMRPWLATMRGLIGEHAKVAVEYADSINYQPRAHSLRTMILLSGTMDNVLQGWNWR
jgi:Capsule assembly protein Wzi